MKKEITVNGRKHDTDEDELGQEDVCKIAGEPPYATVTFHLRGTGIGGSLSGDKRVKVANGMQFNCVVTGNA